MIRKQILVLSLVLLFVLVVRIAFADVPLTSTYVSYEASDSVSYYGSPEMVAFDINVRLECEANYTYLVDGDFPGTAVCYIGTEPFSGTMSVDYFIHCPMMSDSDGHESIPLPQGGQELIGDSPPIGIPVDSAVGTIEIIIHGLLLGVLSLDSKNSNASMQWSTWNVKNITITANAPSILSLSTKYNVSFTVNVAITGFDVVSVNTTGIEVLGDPYEFVIPEFSSFLILPMFMIATLLAVIAYKRKRLM